MTEGTQAILKGGCGCLLAFAALALLAVLAGGHAHIDFGGAVCLFAVGGTVGLVVYLIYDKGRRDASQSPRAGGSPPPPPDAD